LKKGVQRKNNCVGTLNLRITERKWGVGNSKGFLMFCERGRIKTKLQVSVPSACLKLPNFSEIKGGSKVSVTE